MNRDEVWQAIDHERSTLADLFDDLSAKEWETASLCDGWRVRDVAAHLTLAHGASLLQMASWMLRARGSMNRMIHDTAVQQAELPVERYSALLRAMVGSRKTAAPGLTPFEPLIDVLVHGQDITIPLGRDRPMPPRAAAAAATRAWERKGWPFWAKRRMSGFELVATDHSWSVGQGRRVEGSIGTILLVLTGRTAALPHLSGPGAADLRARLSPAAARR
ncbi:maleylpyruvate isomerase family mycothiol-dependent enzyme [Planobispora rosea]|uniref:maleylpyruvate isomerase family mycothiol-dependent enzyme n=1 Tax=Planobispora rosea TaxID=35762 RepID=UPI00083B6110|nr:maleylpyruvate isomerase family mycothiol-dependent enzyme [Planobispora rosea]